MKNLLAALLILFLSFNRNAASYGENGSDDLSNQEKIEMIANLELLEELEVLQNMDLVENYEMVKNRNEPEGEIDEEGDS